MLTTLGPTCLAICENELDNSTGLGMTSGEAPGATLESSFAAFTPWLITVPITIPTQSVNTTRLNERIFCVRILSKKLMDLITSACVQGQLYSLCAPLYSWMYRGIQWFHFD